MSQSDESIESFADFRFPLTEAQILQLQPPLRRLAASFKVPAEDRDDMVQHAVVALIDGRRKWTNPVVAARSAMLDWLRKKQLQHRMDCQPIEESVAERMTCDPEALKEFQEFRGMGLDDRHRLVGRLYFIDGLSQTEIAKEIGCCQMTVSNMVATIREAVREKHLTPDE